MNFYKSIVIVFILCSITAMTQNQSDITVDNNGIMRWPDQSEVKGFGINYTVPFAHGYRFAQNMGVDPKAAIKNDVYHFSRLGFDLYRVHVWDTEISDSLGNLIENEHLDAFDFLLKELKDKGFHLVLTPIAFWGNGWPEGNEDTPGFSHKYGKDDCLTDPDAILAQHNYLQQFLNHTNPYTGLAYKNDPDIIAFEVSNEPHHKGTAKEVTSFVKGMVDAMRKTGTQKPIFYNISHAVHFADAYFEAGIQGGTFQWYPTGLGYQRELPGNSLPNVNRYEIPFDATIKKYHGAKLVYEFDAADVGKSYIYPAMARSFREAGIQIATHFAYDPTYSAFANTEYNTHYMNLAYTPQKALSLMISSEVFHQIPMTESQGEYPQNLAFGDFIVDYPNNLAEYNSINKFIYTNTTNSIPKDENQLKMIAGFGNSELIQYSGLGAYFLDRIDDGIWRLEVMPDAISVADPYGRNSPKKTVTVINWKTHTMTVQLKNLGQEFELEAINSGNIFASKVKNRSFEIEPGTYILSATASEKNWTSNDDWGYNKLNDFYAPASTVNKPWFKHNPEPEVSENSPLNIKVQYVSPEEIKGIQVAVSSFRNRKVIDMKNTIGYNYTATIPSEMLKAGSFDYHIIVQTQNGKTITYPAGHEGSPFDWDFYDRSPYQVRVVPKTFPIYLFNAANDARQLVIPWRNFFRLVPTKNEGEAEYQINLEKLYEPDSENLNEKPIYDYSFKHFILDKIEGRKEDLKLMKQLVLQGRALNNKPCKLQMAFIMDNGAAFGKTLEIGLDSKEYKLALSDLKPVKTVTLPRPYPGFLPYNFSHQNPDIFNINRIESIQFSIGPDIPENEKKDPHGITLIRVKLE